MQKLNNKGFILAETLVVSVFIMLLFTMIYSNFFPLIGEYEKKENYDDVDGKYTAYWIKKIIESEDYTLTQKDISLMNEYGYIRFNCSNVKNDNNQRSLCIDIVKQLEISGCDGLGNSCDIFITRYQIGNSEESYNKNDFKDTIRKIYWMRKYYEPCIGVIDPNSPQATAQNIAFANEASCGSVYFQECCASKGLSTCTKPVFSSLDYSSFYRDEEKTDEKDQIAESCSKSINKKVFNSSLKDYILSLPNYTKPHYTTGAAYRVIVSVHHEKDNNNFYSYSNMEVNK